MSAPRSVSSERVDSQSVAATAAVCPPVTTWEAIQQWIEAAPCASVSAYEFASQICEEANAVDYTLLSVRRLAQQSERAAELALQLSRGAFSAEDGQED